MNAQGVLKQAPGSAGDDEDEMAPADRGPEFRAWLAGRTIEARRILDSLKERYAATRSGAGELAQVYIGLGEFDLAFEWLSRAVDEGGVRTLKVAVVWDPIRSDPRFEEVLRKSGLGG